MAANYYSLIIECITCVQVKVEGRHGAPIFQLNKRQCEYVAQELLKVSQSLQDKGADNFKPGSRRVENVLLHLHATVKRAQTLVERCCCENSSWLAAAMTFGDSKEEVIAILLDLYQWTFVLDIALSASAGGSHSSQLQLLETGEEGYQRLLKQKSKMQNAIRDAARQDQEELLEKIASSVGPEDQRDDLGYIRGVYLKSRLNHTEGDLQSVQELKAYTFSRDLGSGASGMVLQVKWLGHELALKILKVIDRTEATILGRLQHPNIVRLYHYWEELTPDPRSCIIMELMPRDLQKHIANELRKQSGLSLKSKKGLNDIMPFSLSVAIDTMLQVAQAMRQVHEEKLTHRDLKTSNILVKPVSEGYLELHTEGYLEVKLADFGSAKAYANSSITGDLTRNTGTTVYGAPEVFGKEKIEMERNFPPKADVWSFGMTCSEILTGRVPFADEPRPTLHTRIRKNGLRPRFPEDCPDYLKFCIESCWALEPQRRPSFADLCRMLRLAKFLSLGLMDLENRKCLFAYQTYSGVMKTSIDSLHPQEGSKMSRFGFDILRRHNLRGSIGGTIAKSLQPSTSSDSRDQFRVPIMTRLFHYRSYKMLLQIQTHFAELDAKPTMFSYNELRAATRDFHEDMKLGQGGFGAVYKAILPDGNLVAVKQLFERRSPSGIDEFFNEVNLIGGMRHRHLVALKGCCIDQHQKLLVYEYVDNYDVDQILLEGPRRQDVSWPLRLEICLGIARGLHYLHAMDYPKIIHRDIKASNVLLDKNLVPKIADFGLALLFPDEQSHIKTVHVAGTRGYLAPEYASLGQLSEKVDVYSFGVLCLEIVSGRRNIDKTLPVDQVYLSKYAWHLHKEDRLMELVDRTLHLNKEEKWDVQRVIKVCLLCIQTAPEKRPTMKRIESILESDSESEVAVLGESEGGNVEHEHNNIDGLTGITGIIGMTRMTAGRRKTF